MRLPTLATAVLLIGCSAFETRTPHDPSAPGGSWQEPTADTVVFINFQNALQEEIMTNYARCLAADFSFLADPKDTLLAEPGTFSDWDLPDELEVTQKILDQTGAVILAWEDSLDPSQADTASTFYKVYQIWLIADTTTYAHGLSRFGLVLGEDGYWAIQEWEDVRLDTTDWGELKGAYR